VDRIPATLNRCVAPVLLTADLVDYWVRRQVIEFLVAQEAEQRRDPSTSTMNSLRLTPGGTLPRVAHD